MAYIVHVYSKYPGFGEHVLLGKEGVNFTIKLMNLASVNDEYLARLASILL